MIWNLFRYFYFAGQIQEGQRVNHRPESDQVSKELDHRIIRDLGGEN